MLCAEENKRLKGKVFMSKFLYELEKKWGKYSIQNLPLMLIMCYAVGFLINMINPNFLGYLTLNPYYILKGQVWRVLTWIVIPPSSSNLFFVLIMLYFYYSISRTLERSWGTFYLNVYLLSGIVFNFVGSFVIYLIGGLMYGFNAHVFQMIGAIIAACVSTYYVNMAIFLAYAATFPDNEILLFFILPIKVKILGIIYALILAYEIFAPLFTYGVSGGVWIMAAVPMLSLLNFIVFFFSTRKTIHLTHAQKAVRKNFRNATRGNGGFGQRAANGGSYGFGQGSAQLNGSRSSAQTPQMRSSAPTRHKCAVCGQTETTAPDLSFRFCTKCEGSYEYCENHIFTHTHVKKS